MFWKKNKKEAVSSHHENPVPIAGDARRVARNEARLAHLAASIESLKARHKVEKDSVKRDVIAKKLNVFERERTIRTAMKEV